MATGNPLLSTLRGRIGDITFRQRKGTQVSAKRQPVVSNPRSYSQMNVRTQLSNLCAFYRVLEGFWSRAFEDKKQKQTEFNAFTSANLNSDVRVYLTKEQAAANVCYLAAYKISSGTLPSITYGPAAVGSSYLITNIQLPADFDMSAATTVAQLSQAIVDNNNAWELNDQLSFVSMTQDGTTATADLYEITLDLDNTASYVDYLPEGVFAALKYEDDGKTYLAFVGADGSALVHSRWLKNKGLKVSDQRLYVISPKYKQKDNATYALNAAISYGGSADAFLSSGSEANAINERSAFVDGIYYVDDSGAAYNLNDIPDLTPFNNKLGEIQVRGANLTSVDWTKVSILLDGYSEDGVLYKSVGNRAARNYVSGDYAANMSTDITDTTVTLKCIMPVDFTRTPTAISAIYLMAEDSGIFDGTDKYIPTPTPAITGASLVKGDETVTLGRERNIIPYITDGYKLVVRGENLRKAKIVAAQANELTGDGEYFGIGVNVGYDGVRNVLTVETYTDTEYILSLSGAVPNGASFSLSSIMIYGLYPLTINY